jgi:hypothetical protein
MSDYRVNAAPARFAGSWDSSLQGHVTELNFRFLHVLAGAADSGLMQSSRSPSLTTPIVEQLELEWQRMTPPRLRLLAQCPYLLLDAGFSVPERWRAMVTGSVQDVGPTVQRAHDPVGIELVRRTLVLAWHLARANPLAARITLGMNAECIELIASRGLYELEAVAESQPAWVRPRWESKLEVWRQLLRAACDDQITRLRQLQLRGVQLLAGSTMVRAAGE